MIGVGIVGFALSAMLFGHSFVGWVGMVVFAVVFVAGLFKEAMRTQR